jgi:hypothetical protein
LTRACPEKGLPQSDGIALLPVHLPNDAVQTGQLQPWALSLLVVSETE